MALLSDLPIEAHLAITSGLTSDDARVLSQTCIVLRNIYAPISWRRCVVTHDRTPCIYTTQRAIPPAVFLSPHDYSWFYSHAVHEVFVHPSAHAHLLHLLLTYQNVRDQDLARAYSSLRVVRFEKTDKWLTSGPFYLQEERINIGAGVVVVENMTSNYDRDDFDKVDVFLYLLCLLKLTGPVAASWSDVALHVSVPCMPLSFASMPEMFHSLDIDCRYFFNFVSLPQLPNLAVFTLHFGPLSELYEGPVSMFHYLWGLMTDIDNLPKITALTIHFGIRMHDVLSGTVFQFLQMLSGVRVVWPPQVKIPLDHFHLVIDWIPGLRQETFDDEAYRDNYYCVALEQITHVSWSSPLPAAHREAAPHWNSIPYSIMEDVLQTPNISYFYAEKTPEIEFGMYISRNLHTLVLGVTSVEYYRSIVKFLASCSQIRHLEILDLMENVIIASSFHDMIIEGLFKNYRKDGSFIPKHFRGHNNVSLSRKTEMLIQAQQQNTSMPNTARNNDAEDEENKQLTTMIWRMAKQTSLCYSSQRAEYTPANDIWVSTTVNLLKRPMENLTNEFLQTTINDAIRSLGTDDVLVLPETTLVELLSFWECVFETCLLHLSHLEHASFRCMEIVALSPRLHDLLGKHATLQQALLVFELKNTLFQDSVFSHMPQFPATVYQKTAGPDKARGFLHRRHELLLDLHSYNQNYHFNSPDVQHASAADARDTRASSDDMLGSFAPKTVPFVAAQGSVTHMPYFPQMRVVTSRGTPEGCQPALGEFSGWI